MLQVLRGGATRWQITGNDMPEASEQHDYWFFSHLTAQKVQPRFS